MGALPDPKELGRCHAKMRRVCDCILLALTLGIAGAGMIAWLFTRNPDHLYAGLFYAAFPFIGLVYFHCVLLNPRRDPVETQRQLRSFTSRPIVRTTCRGQCGGWDWAACKAPEAGIAVRRFTRSERAGMSAER